MSVGFAASTTLPPLDGQSLPFADASFDAFIRQLGLMFFPNPAHGLSEFRRVLRDGGRTAVSVTTTPERSLFAHVRAVIARHVPARAEKLNRFFSIPDTDHLHRLVNGAGFSNVEVQSETRSIGFASFSAYFSGIEKGATTWKS